jgi:CheY-like chemotaxis protein
LQMG